MARPKKTAQNVHAKRRAQERHGLQLNKRALREIVEQIRSNKARFIVRSSHRAKVFAVMVNGKEIAVVYDNKSHTIVTFGNYIHYSLDKREGCRCRCGFELAAKVETTKAA